MSVPSMRGHRLRVACMFRGCTTGRTAWGLILDVQSRPSSSFLRAFSCRNARGQLMAPMGWLRHRNLRWCSSSAAESNALIASQTSNVGRLAAAIAGQVREGDSSTVSAVGAAASYAAIKSIVIATRYLQDTHPGKCLALSPERCNVTGGKSDTVGMLLHIRLVESEKVPLQHAVDLFVAKDTNVGMMAGLMVNIVNGAGVATIGGMGADATNAALKATVIAQRYMADSLGDADVLALVPRFDTFEKNGEEFRRLLLSCVRTGR